MTTIVKAAGPVDLLAMVPSLVGFAPRNSVVLVAFRGNRTCGAMRFNLPNNRANGTANKSIDKRFVTTIVGTLCKLPKVDAAVIVVYTDEQFGEGRVIPRSDLARLLAARIELSGFRLRESMCQAADGWASQFDDDVPVGGRPLEEVNDSPVNAKLAAERPLSVAPQDMERRVADADAKIRARTDKRLAMYQRLSRNIDELDGGSSSALDDLGDIPFLAEVALDWDDIAIEDHGAMLIFALQPPPFRDLVMMQWASSIEVGYQLFDEDYLGDREGGVDVGDLMLGRADRPDPERIEAGIALLLKLVAMATDDKRPPLLCMLAWLNWALGRASRGGVYLDEATAIDPNYSMAELLNSVLASGYLPEWAFDVQPASI